MVATNTLDALQSVDQDKMQTKESEVKRLI